MPIHSDWKVLPTVVFFFNQRWNRSLPSHNVIQADAHMPTSTPTVRRHAEACLSTTYAKSRPCEVTKAVAARCGGVTPTNILEDSGRVLNPILTLIAIDRKSCKNFGISWSNHRILKLERPPPDFPKLFAPHRVPYPGKFFSGHTGDR